MSGRMERPDLEVITRSLDFPPSPLATSISGYWRQQLLDVIAYALQLEQDVAGARERLAELEWSGDMFNGGGYCFHCGNLKTEGHMPDCGLAALVALLAAAS